MIGREFPDVLANTTSAFGLGDWEWILAFEADDLERLVDCIRRLRDAKARLYTKEEIPFVTGIRKSVADALDGSGVVDTPANHLRQRSASKSVPGFADAAPEHTLDTRVEPFVPEWSLGDLGHGSPRRRATVSGTESGDRTADHGSRNGRAAGRCPPDDELLSWFEEDQRRDCREGVWRTTDPAVRVVELGRRAAGRGLGSAPAGVMRLPSTGGTRRTRSDEAEPVRPRWQADGIKRVTSPWMLDPPRGGRGVRGLDKSRFRLATDRRRCLMGRGGVHDGRVGLHLGRRSSSTHHTCVHRHPTCCCCCGDGSPRTTSRSMVSDQRSNGSWRLSDLT